MSFPSTSTGYAATLSDGSPAFSPVRTLYCHMCQGQVTTSPSRNPSPSGPPRCRQVLSSAYTAPSTLNRATALPLASTVIEEPGPKSDKFATLTNSAIVPPHKRHHG